MYSRSLLYLTAGYLRYWKAGKMQLHASVSKRDVASVRQLANSESVKELDSEGRTPLQRACSVGDKKVVKALLRVGAHLGDNEVRICQQYGHEELACYLASKLLHSSPARGRQQSTIEAIPVSINAALGDYGPSITRIDHALPRLGAAW